jgi:hypothetical protein
LTFVAIRRYSQQCGLFCTAIAPRYALAHCWPGPHVPFAGAYMSCSSPRLSPVCCGPSREGGRIA